MARLVRAVLALLLGLAALAVLSEMAAVNHWGPVSIRLPLLLLTPWAYASAPRSRWVAGLALLSLMCLSGAALTIVTPSLGFESPQLLNGLGGVGLVALGIAVALEAWLTVLGWRADRARLRARSKGRLERLSGGF